MELNSDSKILAKKLDLLAKLHEKYLNWINNIMMIQMGMIKENIEKLVVINPIWRYIDNRLSTVILLIEKWLLWDAEIIFRPALEATLKFIKIVLLNSDKNHLTNVEDFWNSFSEINSLKRSDKAKELSSEAGDNLDTHYKELLRALCLDESTERELREKWPKRLRSILNENWSFNKMVKELKESSIIPDNVKPIISLLCYQYQLSSNIIHGDESGSMFELTRDPQDILNEPKNHEHFAKLLIETTLLYATVALMTSIYLAQHKKTSEIKDIIIQIVLSKKDDEYITESLNK